MITGHNRVTVHMFHTLARLKVPAINMCTRRSRNSIRHFGTSRTCLIKGNGGPVSTCLSVRSLVHVTGSSNTSNVRPKCNFLSRGVSFTEHYRRRNVGFVNPSLRRLSVFNSGVGTGITTIRTNVRSVPKSSNPMTGVSRIVTFTRTCGCPVVVGTTLNNNKHNVHVTFGRRRTHRNFRETHDRTLTTFNGSRVCIRGCVRSPGRVRVRVLKSRRNGVIRLCRHSYSIRHHRRGMIRITPYISVSSRIHRRVYGTTLRLVGRINCMGTKAIRFLLRNSRFCFVRIGPHIRIRRAVARLVAKVSVIRSRVLVTRKRSLRGRVNVPRRRGVPLVNTTVRYQVAARSPLGGFFPSAKGVGACHSPNNFNVQLSTNGKFRNAIMAPFFSSLLIGLYIRTSAFSRTIHGARHSLVRFQVHNMGAGVPFVFGIVARPVFMSNSTGAAFVSAAPRLFRFPGAHSHNGGAVRCVKGVAIGNFPNVRGNRGGFCSGPQVPASVIIPRRGVVATGGVLSRGNPATIDR